MRVAFDDYAKLIEPVKKRMVNSVWRIVRDADDTEDIIQDSLEKILKKFTRIRSHPNPTAMILRICINSAYDHLRRQSKQRQKYQYLENNSISSENTPSEILAQDEKMELVLNKIQELPKREAESLMLLALENFTYSEIAQAMNCREGTIRSMVSKARHRLETLLANEQVLNSGGI